MDSIGPFLETTATSDEELAYTNMMLMLGGASKTRELAREEANYRGRNFNARYGLILLAWMGVEMSILLTKVAGNNKLMSTGMNTIFAAFGMLYVQQKQLDADREVKFEERRVIDLMRSARHALEDSWGRYEDAVEGGIEDEWAALQARLRQVQSEALTDLDLAPVRQACRNFVPEQRETSAATADELRRVQALAKRVATGVTVKRHPETLLSKGHQTPRSPRGTHTPNVGRKRTFTATPSTPRGKKRTQ